MARRRKKDLPSFIKVPRRWRRHWLGILLAAILATGVAYERATRDPLPRSETLRYNDRTVRVVHVVDGDTLDIALPDGDKPTTRVRLWGVDTPESVKPGEPPMYFAQEASDFAHRTLAGREVLIELSPKKNRDKYDRLLAYVYLERGGAMFNEMLLEQGYAYADTRFDHLYDARFEQLERSARRNGAGLWAAVKPEQMPEWRQRIDRKAAARNAPRP